MIKIAFFDIDGTVSKRPLPEHMIKIIDSRSQVVEDVELSLKKNRLDVLKERYRISNSDDDFNEYSTFMTEYLMFRLKGYSGREVRELAKEAIDRAMAYKFSDTLIDELRKSGYYLVAISGSPQILVDAFVEKFNFTAGIGQKYNLDPEDLIYKACGKQTWHKKQEIVYEFLRDKFPNNEREDFQIISVGDTAGDFEMLRLADVAFAINPSETLNSRIANEFSLNHNFFIVESSKNSATIVYTNPNYCSFCENFNIIESDSVFIASGIDAFQKVIRDILSKKPEDLHCEQLVQMSASEISRFEKENF